MNALFSVGMVGATAKLTVRVLARVGFGPGGRSLDWE